MNKKRVFFVMGVRVVNQLDQKGDCLRLRLTFQRIGKFDLLLWNFYLGKQERKWNESPFCFALIERSQGGAMSQGGYERGLLS